MNHIKRAAVVITAVLTVLLTACGQKGPLYLPQDETPDIEKAEVSNTELSTSTAEPSTKSQAEEELEKPDQ